jgi:hypothetical protein
MLLLSFSLISPEHDFLYIPIDKNASSRIKNELFTNNWKLVEDIGMGIKPFESNTFFKLARKFAVLRDPYDRWLTGFTTFVSYQDPKFFNLPLHDLLKSAHWHITLHMLFENRSDLEFDWHTKPQYRYFFIPGESTPNIDDLEDISFFRYDVDLTLKLQKWFKSMGLENMFNIDYYENKRSKSNLIYNNLVNFLNEHPHYKEKLMTWLQPDYEFVNSIKFVV